MRRLLTFLLFIIPLQMLQAKVFIHHPGANEGDEVWFRSNFFVETMPDSVTLHLSTSGYALAYVNGRIAFSETIWPYRPLIDTIDRGNSLPPARQYKRGIASRDIDVTHLLRRGRNVIAIWYAPCINVKAMIEAEKQYAFIDSLASDSNAVSFIRKTPKGAAMQISASLTATRNKKTETLLGEDGAWLCHIAAGRMTLEGEEFNATRYLSDWKALSCYIDPSWVMAERLWTEQMKWNTLDNIGLTAFRTTNAKINHKTTSKHTYYIPSEATGQLRLTLRDTSKGQRILVNGMTYRCFGTNDEQIFTRFATINTDCITIESTEGKPVPDIQYVEFIELRQTNNRNNNINCFQK